MSQSLGFSSELPGHTSLALTKAREHSGTMSILDILVTYRQGFLDGLLVTLRLCLIIWSIGLVAGCMLGAAGARWHVAIGWPSRTIAFVLSGIPILVFLFWLHYPFQALLDVVIDPFITAAITLSIVNIFMVSELIRGILKDFPRQYIIAAQVCGLSPIETLISIQLPIILRQSLPGLLSIQVNMLQATLFASLISVDEIFRVAQRINASIYKPVEIYTALGVLFLAICLPLNLIAYRLKNKYTRNLSEK